MISRLFITLGIIFSLVFTTVAQAEDISFCATVVPCDENGDIIAPYDNQESPCYSHYKQVCDQTKIKLLTEQLKYYQFLHASCEGDKGLYEKENTKLKKRLRKTKRKLKAATIK